MILLAARKETVADTANNEDDNDIEFQADNNEDDDISNKILVTNNEEMVMSNDECANNQEVMRDTNMDLFLLNMHLVDIKHEHQ